MIVSDGDRVLQIISNLLSNAFRWTPDGGRIGLELASQNGTVTVDVADTGPGIGQEERERIFRPFWSTDGRGTGLGLPIARELAVALGGRIELQTALGQGSRFRLVLPLWSALAGVAERVDRAADGGALDLLEPGVDALPARRDEVDEQREVVDARVPLGEQVALEPLEPADRLVQQAADLGEVRATGSTSARRPSWTAAPIFSGSVPSSSAAASASASICVRARSSAASSSAGATRPDAASAIRALARSSAARPRGARATLAVGWTPPSSTTTCRRS